MKTGRIRAALVAVALTSIAAIAAAGVAFAAKPIKGAKYAGSITRVVHSGGHTFRSSLAISFKVSSSGKRVSSFALPQGYPVYCQGGGFGSPQAASGKVSKKGTFKVKLALVFAPTHQHQGFVIVTGKFAAHGKESGKVTTDFTSFHGCNGTSSYKTTG